MVNQKFVDYVTGKIAQKVEDVRFIKCNSDQPPLSMRCDSAEFSAVPSGDNNYVIANDKWTTIEFDLLPGHSPEHANSQERRNKQGLKDKCSNGNQ